MKKDLSSIILVGIFIIGLSVLLYPSLSDYWNSKVQSKAIVEYEAKLNELSDTERNQLFYEAEQYNNELSKLSFPLVEYDKVKGYNNILNINNDGIIGYISIDKIKVELPIYHGTSSEVLNVAAGHLTGSSLPIGGDSTHSIISAHRGLPSAKLFTDLDQLEVGDTFRITILNKVITYSIDQILIVEPEDIKELGIVEGEDYCTLLTCTPYGINTHRLLVRGTRIENLKGKPNLYITSDAFRVDPLVATPAVAAPMLVALLIVLLIKNRKKGANVKKSKPASRAKNSKISKKKKSSKGGKGSEKA